METSRPHSRKPDFLRISDSVSFRVAKAVRKAASRKFSAFTLAELIVVVTILAILATIGFLALSGYQRDAKDSVDKTNVKSIYTAISLESASTGNSPRYYVVHDPSYALSWSTAIVVFDGNSVPLAGGNWNALGTNYSAGNPDYVKLKLNPEKFKVAFSKLPFGSLSSAFAATDPGFLLVGAADILSWTGSSARRRSVAQVVAVMPSGVPVISGDFPSSLSGSVPGLVHDVTNSASTGALVDGAKVGSAPGCSAQTVSGYSAPTLVSGQSASVSKTTANGTVSATAYCSYGNVAVSSETASCNSGYVPSGLSCVADVCGSTVPANASSNASSQAAAGTWHYAASAGQCTFACVANYSWDGSSCKASCNVPVSDTYSGQTYAVTPSGSLAHGASLTSSGTSAFGLSPANGMLAAVFSYSCSDGTLSKNVITGTGGCQANYTWNSSWSSPSCAANGQTFTCVAKPATGTVWNTVSSYGQTWNGSAWLPASSATAYNATASSTSCNYACASGYSWDGSACQSNCLASTPTVNAHPYSVSAFNHATTLSPTSVVAIANGTRTYQQTFSCANGTVTASGSETNTANTCNSGYAWNSPTCVVSSINLTIAANTNNYNIFTAALSPTTAKTVNVTINAGVIVGSTSTATPALTTGVGWPAGSVINLVNNGYVVGKGGQGGFSESSYYGYYSGWNGSWYTSDAGSYSFQMAGTVGGPALQAQYAMNVTNNGTIGWGGGGGGAWTSDWSSSMCGGTAWSGGGGAGYGAGGYYYQVYDYVGWAYAWQHYDYSSTAPQGVNIAGAAGSATAGGGGAGNGGGTYWNYYAAYPGGWYNCSGDDGDGNCCTGLAWGNGGSLWTAWGNGYTWNGYGYGTTSNIGYGWPGWAGGAATLGNANINWGTVWTRLGALQ